MRVCPVCQRPAVKHLSSHLSMVHGLNGHERTPHLKNAVLYSTTTPSPVQPLRTKAEKAKTKKNIHPRQKRQVAQHLRQASGKEPTTDIKPEPYPSFRFRHKFSLMIVGPSMSGKVTPSRSYWKKIMSITRSPIHVERYTGFMDSIRICLRI